jgi:hypothetical protein
MPFEINCIGLNFTKDDDEYIFTPFTTKNAICLKMKKNGNIAFTLIQSAGVNYTTIYRYSKQKIKIFDTEKKIIISHTKDEIIKLVVNYNNTPNSKIMFKNILVKDFAIGNIINPAEINHINKEEFVNAISSNSENNNSIFNKSGDVDINNKKNDELTHKLTFIIVTTKWGIKIAESLNNMLIELGHKSTVVKDIISDEMLSNNKTRPNEYFIILFSHLIPKMPEPNKYIIYQLEQKRQSNIITEKVLDNILNSLICWDYSNENILHFVEPYRSKLVFQPISIINKIQTYNLPLRYDILFFGCRSKRRDKILSYLKNKKYNILITHKIFGNDLYKIISRSRIIINLHVYEDAILETARLNEVLPFNKLIISELPCAGDFINKNFYQNKVVFCDIIRYNLSNIRILTNLINYYLVPDNYNKFINNNSDNINQIYSNSIIHLQKNLDLIKLLSTV